MSDDGKIDRNSPSDLEDGRLKKVLQCLKQQEIDICEKLANSAISRENDSFPKTVTEQWLIMDNRQGTKLVHRINEALEKNRQTENINRFKNQTIVNQIESSSKMEKSNRNKFEGLQTMQDLLQKLVDLKNSKCILKGMLKSSYDEKDENISKLISDWLSMNVI